MTTSREAASPVEHAAPVTSRVRKPKVAFVCTHNSCRSQIAEALGRKLAADVFESYSAGTEPNGRINEDARRLVLERHGVDMVADGQRSKLLSEIPAPDVVVLMGCGVSCPALRAGRTEDWGLEDPTGKGDAEFLRVIDEIERKVILLRDRIS